MILVEGVSDGGGAGGIAETALLYVPLVSAAIALASVFLAFASNRAAVRRTARRDAQDSASQALSLVLSTEVQRARSTVGLAARTDPLLWRPTSNGTYSFTTDQAHIEDVAEASLRLLWTIQQVRPHLTVFSDPRVHSAEATATIESTYAALGFMVQDLNETLAVWGRHFDYRDPLVEAQKAIARLPEFRYKPLPIDVHEFDPARHLAVDDAIPHENQSEGHDGTCESGTAPRPETPL